MLVLGGGEGIGKDFLMLPLVKAMGDNSKTISGESLLENYNSFLLSTKHLHINETDLGDRTQSIAVSNKLKPLAASPPDTIRMNEKYLKSMTIDNIVNCSMGTNTPLPFRLNDGPSRRFYGMWSQVNVLDANQQILPHWVKYFQKCWTWMNRGGWENVVHHLIYEVDLSNFDPKVAPPMTDFIRGIHNMSKTLVQQTLEIFIDSQAGAFGLDLATSTDLSKTIRSGIINPDDIMTDVKYFTPSMVGRTMTNIKSFKQLKASSSAGLAKIWVLNDLEKYEGMTKSQLHDSYKIQIDKFYGMNNALRIVN
jgi:hypothetical protein